MSEHNHTHTHVDENGHVYEHSHGHHHSHAQTKAVLNRLSRAQGLHELELRCRWMLSVSRRPEGVLRD